MHIRGTRVYRISADLAEVCTWGGRLHSGFNADRVFVPPCGCYQVVEFCCVPIGTHAPGLYNHQWVLMDDPNYEDRASE